MESLERVLAKSLKKVSKDSKDRTIHQCRQTVHINPYYSSNLHEDGSIYIQLPRIEELIELSNISVDGSEYEIIVDKNIVRNPKTILVKNYNMIFIRLYDFNNLLKIKISFDATFANFKRISSKL
jgi:hypothetical protein